MKRSLRLVLLLAATVVACARPTPERQIIDDAAAAMGGGERIRAVETLMIEAEGTNGNLGQEMTPDAAVQTWTVTGYTRAVDVATGRVRIQQTRTPDFAYFMGNAPQTQIQGLDGDVGYSVAASGAATRLPNSVVGDMRAERYHHPLTIVRAALDPATQLSNPRTMEHESVVDLTMADGATFTMAIDATTRLPTRVVSMADNTNLGDVAVETRFAEYQDVDGLQLPARLTTRIDDYTTADLRVTSQTLDGEVGDLAVPADAASVAPITGPAPPNVTVEEVADAIWLLAGQSHHSVLVEFDDHLMLIEAPQHDTRTLAVIAKARELRPDKPLTHVVESHHHFDHSGGIRAAVSEGLTVVTHRVSAPFHETNTVRPHTIAPDALSQHPMALKVETVDDSLILKDDAMEVVLYPIVGSSHADTLLMAYFPRERILVEADVYVPGRPVAPYAANLLENIRKLNLRVDRIVPIHGGIVPFAELVKTVESLATH